MEIKYKILGITLVCLFLCTLFFGIATSGSGTNGYDPWVDLNDDGNIDYNDLYTFARAYGSSGTPINKTALLLQLLSRIDSLNASLIALESRVEALEARIPKKGYISISPTAFTPSDQVQSYSKNGAFLQGGGNFYAPIYLPSGVKITNMTAKLYDNDTSGEITVELKRVELYGTSQSKVLASVRTGIQEAPGPVVLYDDSIDFAIVDNQQYNYFVDVYLSYWNPNNPLELRWILLEYEYPA
jgi:hypothetical protein